MRDVCVLAFVWEGAFLPLSREVRMHVPGTWKSEDNLSCQSSPFPLCDVRAVWLSPAFLRHPLVFWSLPSGYIG